jgi:hypothetical protein
MNLKEIGWVCVLYIDLAKARDNWLARVKAVMNFGVLYNVENFLIS